MKVTITIDTDNAAFSEGGELARILTNIGHKAMVRGTKELNGLKLMDVNGNTVGQVKVTTPRRAARFWSDEVNEALRKR